MDSGKTNFGEGASINRPPSFNGESYGYWKERMRIFIESIGIEIWEAIENGPFVPMKSDGEKDVEKPRSEWTDDDKKKAQPNLKAKNLITSALSYNEFFRVSNCKSAKEMWDTLRLTHEGTSEVKRSRINSLMHEYELFSMHHNESIESLQLRFTHVVNHLMSLGKTFTNEDLVNKILRCLTREWQPKVTAITESRNLEKLDLATLFGKLKEHELELQRLQSNEDSDKKKKGLALKSSIQNEDTAQTSEDEEEVMNLLVKKFNKFLKNKNRSFKKKPIKKDENIPSSSIICFECGKPGHYKTECPNKKDEKKKKGNKKNFKGKRAYIAWDDNEVSSSTSSSSSDEEANLCLMANKDQDEEFEDASSEVSAFSTHETTIDDLKLAFFEMHDEANKFAQKCRFQKKKITVLESKIESLLKELNDLKIILDEKNLLKSIPAVNCICELCPKKDKEILDLKQCLGKYNQASKNLDDCLSAQKNSFDKSGLGFYTNGLHKHEHHGKPLFVKQSTASTSKTHVLKNKFENQESKNKKIVKKESFVKNSGKPISVKRNKKHTNFKKYDRVYVCTYCGMKGHTCDFCYAKLFFVPIGSMVWVPKGTTTNH